MEQGLYATLPCVEHSMHLPSVSFKTCPSLTETLAAHTAYILVKQRQVKEGTLAHIHSISKLIIKGKKSRSDKIRRQGPSKKEPIVKLWNLLMKLKGSRVVAN